jgi:hypothetical protein
MTHWHINGLQMFEENLGFALFSKLYSYNYQRLEFGHHQMCLCDYFYPYYLKQW